MDFHAFMYVTIGRRHELERGMAGKDPVLYQRMLDEIAEYARVCDATGWSGIGIPEHHLQVEGFELGQDPGLMAMFLGRHGPRLRINQFGYVLPTHNPLRVAEHAATLDHLLGGRLNVAFVRGYQARWFENYAAVPGVKATGPWNRKTDEDAMNRELFEECVAIIKTAWTHDTFSFKGKYWSFPPEASASRTSTRCTSSTAAASMPTAPSARSASRRGRCRTRSPSTPASRTACRPRSTGRGRAASPS